MENSYKIIGGDGREYGPATLDELKSWIRDGRAGATTLVWSNDEGAWKPTTQYPEFAEEIGVQPPKLAAPPVSTRQIVSVGAPRRILAYFIDQIIVAIPVGLVWSAFFAGKVGYEMPSFPSGVDVFSPEFLQPMTEFSVKLMPVYFLIHFAYEVLFNRNFGATPGKMMMGAQIVNLDLSPIGYKTAAVRCLFEYGSQYFFFLGHLFVLWHPEKRALHDLIAQTRVINRK